MLGLLFLLCSWLAVSSGIINGTITARARYPFMVSLQWDGHHKCGGALLNADTILTCAHCYPLIWVDPLQQHRVSALLGTRNQQANGRSRGERVGIRRIIWPDNFEDQYKSKNIMKVSLIAVQSDYMLLKTNRSIRRTNSIGYARLGTDLAGNYFPKIGDRCTTIGWGRYKYPDTLNGTAEIFSKYLRRGDVEIATDSLCMGEASPIPTMLCAKQVYDNVKPKGSPCFGDSGSPLVCSGDDREYLAGLVEGGQLPCNDGRLGFFYMRISTAIQWITKNLRL